VSTADDSGHDSVNGTAHPEFLGAYVLGLVDDDERAAVEAHLETCEQCRSEVAELSGLRGVLAAAPADAVLADLAALDAADEPPGAPGTGDLLLQRTLRELRTETRRSRRLRLVGVAAGIVAVAGLAGFGGLTLGREADEYGGNPPVAGEQLPGRTFTATDPGTGVEIIARVIPANTWTRLNVAVNGVAPGTVCQIVAVATDGRRDVAGSWIIGKPRPGVRRGGVDGSTAIAPGDLARVEIIDGTGKRLVGVDA
jgi:hypothetical protein